jgi:hypothetical protein
VIQLQVQGAARHDGVVFKRDSFFHGYPLSKMLPFPGNREGATPARS